MKSYFQALYFFIKPYRSLYVKLLFIMVIYAVLESVNISIFFPLFKSALGQDQVAGQAFYFLDRMISILPIADPFLRVGVFAILVLSIKEIFGFLQQAMIGYGTAKVVAECKEKIFEKFIRSEYSFFLKNKQGDLSYKALFSPSMLGKCLLFIPCILTSLLIAVSIGAVLFAISVQVTTLMMVLGILFQLLIGYFSKKVSFHIGTERVAVGLKAQVVMNEFMDGVKHIRILNAFDFWRDKFFETVRRFKTLSIWDSIWLDIPERMVRMVPVLALMIFAFFLNYLKNENPQTLLSYVGVISVYGVAFYKLLPHVAQIGKLQMQVLGALPEVKMLHELLTAKDELFQEGTVELRDFHHRITFENVSFGYNKSKPILRGLTLSFDCGKVYAITGASGAGKSTLANLLTLLFQPDEGSIQIDQMDIRLLKRSSLAALVHLVSQETFIFHGTIFENIVFGMQAVTPSDVMDAARRSYAHEFIEKLPEGYQTVVGDKGLKLSGGQRQRIALARAILRNPKILILDEATSALDEYSQVCIQRAISDFCSEDRTIITIAHRLSSFKYADQILFLSQGKILAQGQHEHLMKTCGDYAHLYEAHVP